MSLAIYAAPFNNDTNMDLINNENDTPINRKKNSNNKTQRNVPKQNYSEKVNSVLQTMQAIQNLPDEQNDLGDFNPPPPPTSVGVLQTQMRENQKPKVFPPNTNIDYVSNSDLYLLEKDAVMPNQKTNYQIPQQALFSGSPGQQQQIQQQQIQQQQQAYYKKLIPNYNAMYNSSPYNMPYYHDNNSNNNNSNSNNNPVYTDENTILLNKLNYMINLLEQNQDEKTQNVTEEIILYCFLGIFLIFIVDSFARVGKYTR
jgi:hypothetical protein